MNGGRVRDGAPGELTGKWRRLAGFIDGVAGRRMEMSNIMGKHVAKASGKRSLNKTDSFG